MPARINIDAATRQIIKNYNNKVYRLRKKGQDIEYLKLSTYAQMSSNAQSNTLRFAESFRRRGSEKMTEYGVKQYELDYAKSLLDTVNQQRYNRLTKMQPSPYKGNLNIVARANLEPRGLDLSSPENFRKMLKSLEEEANPEFWAKSDADYKEGYFLAARENLGEDAERQLRELLDDVDPADVYLLGVDMPELYIDYEYISNKNNANEVNDRTRLIVDRWKEVLGKAV